MKRLAFLALILAIVTSLAVSACGTQTAPASKPAADTQAKPAADTQAKPAADTQSKPAASSSSATKDDTVDKIKKRGELIVAMTGTNWGFNMVNRNNETIGYDVDIAKKVAEKLGVKLSIQLQKWPGLIPSLQAGKVDMISAGMTITPQRKETVDFSDTYVKEGKLLLVNKAKHPNASSVEEFNKPGIQIGVTAGSTDETAAMAFLPKASILRFDSGVSTGLELQAGRIDAMPANIAWARIYSKLNADKVRLIDKPFQPEDYGIAVAKGADSLRAVVNQVLKELKASGEYQKIYDKWFVTLDWLNEVELLKK